MADTEHEWMSLSEASRYANIRAQVLRGAIIAGELKAYEKPSTTERKPSASRRNALIRISRKDLDEYIRTHWKRASAATFGMAAIGETRCA